MKLNSNSKKKLQDLKIGTKYELEVEVQLEEGISEYEVVWLRRDTHDVIEISGYSPLVLGAMYDEGPNFFDGFKEVKYAEIIMALARETSDDPASISFTLTTPHDFEFSFGINAQSVKEVVRKLQPFFKELYSRYDESWKNFEEKVTVNYMD